jgi:uncharacterized protein YciI
MKKRYAYIFFLKHHYDKIKQTLPQHTKYWKSSDVENYMGGTFADDSGGIISFTANGLEEVSEIILNDPLNKQNLIENRLLKEWIVDDGVLS